MIDIHEETGLEAKSLKRFGAFSIEEATYRQYVFSVNRHLALRWLDQLFKKKLDRRTRQTVRKYNFSTLALTTLHQCQIALYTEIIDRFQNFKATSCNYFY